MGKNKRYKNLKKLNKNTKKIIISVVIFILIIIIMEMIINYLEKRESNLNNSNNTYSSIQEILEKYGCTFIKEKENESSGYYKDIYLKFKYNTFEKNESKKRFYENIIGELANFIQRSYKLIDEERNLVIEVKKYSNSSVNTNYIYLINGKEDYFKKEEAKLALLNYEEDKNTNIEINSEILQQLINNIWNKNGINFGTKDSSFDKYDIYFDEGIEVRIISKKVYNIIFTTKYTNSVVNGIVPGTNFEQIISKLGNPIFGTKEGNYIGYKNSNMYIFFTKDNNISIFRNEKTNMTEFEQLLSKYINKEIEIKKFMNELTYLWDDYEEYTYDSNSIYINYPNKGIKINMDSNNSLGISIYKNCNITENISTLIKEEKITGKLENDLVVETMEKNLSKKEDYIYMGSLRENGITENISNLYYLYYDINNNNLMKDILFISKNSSNPNRELNEQINQGIFINDELFLYSIANQGIYLFNIKTNEKRTIITGDDEFKILQYKDNILKYDEKEIKSIME